MNALLATKYADDFVHQWLHYKGYDFEWPFIAQQLSKGVPMHLT